ncbi:signal transduction histidine kinase [Spirosoma lacussanchae]|uniref:PAS domain-containing sensor histidine kinase n=1 Tax=Spirosoma lacussanchae TaxID=1884249 RepID=UPI001109CBA8|nr:PAS domain-containing sensor histidine kinase [Spirosoma lacussanchae]
MQTDLSAVAMAQRILDTSRNGMLLYQPVYDIQTSAPVDLQLSMANRLAEIMLGCSRSVAIGQLMSQQLPRGIDADQLRELLRVAESGDSLSYDVCIRHTECYPNTGWYTITADEFNGGVLIAYTDISAAVQARQEQTELNDFIDVVFSTSLLGISVFEAIRDENGRISDFRLVRINETGAHMNGMQANQLEGKTLRTLYPQTEQVGSFQQYVTVIERNESFVKEQYYPNQNRWYTISGRKFKDGVILTFQNSTDLKRIGQRSDHQTDLLQSVVDNAPVGIILAEAIYGLGDQSGQVVDFRYRLTNRFNAELVGHTVEDMTNQPISALFPDWQQMPLFQVMESVNRTGEARQFSEEYNRYGIRGWFEYYLVKLGDAVLLTFLDVTRLREADEEKKQQADLLQAVVNNSPTGIVLYQAVRDETGQIVDFVHALTNPTNARVTGRSVEEMAGLLMLTDYPSNRTNGHFDDLVQVTETGEPLRRLLDYRAHGINGWYDAQYVKQGDGVLFTYLDVSESQQNRAQLEAANRDLLRSNDNLQQFAYVASHDLQEPLRKIQAFGNLLQMHAVNQLDGTAMGYIDRMQSSAVRMSMLIRDLLAFSRLSTQQEAFLPVSLNELLAELTEDLSTAIDEAQATIRIDSLPVIFGHRLQLYQLFQNLITNAIKFRQQHISPTVEIRCRRVNMAELPDNLKNSAQGRPFIELSVVDNGIGFEEKYLDRIFQVFQRLNSKSQFAGSGVGLAICKKVAENHGGMITATSQLNQGSTFLVYLPVDK